MIYLRGGKGNAKAYDPTTGTLYVLTIYSQDASGFVADMRAYSPQAGGQDLVLYDGEALEFWSQLKRFGLEMYGEVIDETVALGWKVMMARKERLARIREGETK